MLGGAWGAMVGATITTLPKDMPLRRIRSAGSGAAAGIVLAPAVAFMSDTVAEQTKDRLLRRRATDMKEREDFVRKWGER